MVTILGLLAQTERNTLAAWCEAAEDRELVSAADGEALVVSATRNPPDVLVADAALISAGDAWADLVDHPRCEPCQFLLLGADSADEVGAALLEFWLRAPADRVDGLTRPFASGELVLRLERLLQGRERRMLRSRQKGEVIQERGVLRRMVADLSSERDLLRAVLEAGQTVKDHGLVHLDGDGNVVAALGVAGLLGLQCGLPLARQPVAWGPALSSLRRAGAEAGEPLRLRQDGRAFEVHSYALPPATGGGAPTCLVVRDVTNSHCGLEQLRQREASPHLHSSGEAARPNADKFAIRGMVGRSAPLRALFRQVDRLRHSRVNVLVQGASGTGKELVVRSLHFDGEHGATPFVTVHGASGLGPGELFGCDRDGDERRLGLFEIADGGTLFLDDVSELPLEVQAQLLRVLQEGEIQPEGSPYPRFVNVRVLATTSRNLWQLAREGKFRPDLLHRLQVVALEVPRLQRLVDDVPLIVAAFLRRFGKDRPDRPVQSVSTAAMAALQGYPWPGNVRELKHVIQRAFALGVGSTLHVEDLPRRVVEGAQRVARGGSRQDAPDGAGATRGAASERTNQSELSD